MTAWLAKVLLNHMTNSIYSNCSSQNWLYEHLQATYTWCGRQNGLPEPLQASNSLCWHQNGLHELLQTSNTPCSSQNGLCEHLVIKHCEQTKMASCATGVKYSFIKSVYTWTGRFTCSSGGVIISGTVQPASRIHLRARKFSKFSRGACTRTTLACAALPCSA